MYYFCTYFDQHYLSRGLALYHSLEQHCPEFQLWVLCMDTTSYQVLSQMNLDHLRLITLEELEKADTGLKNIKDTRSKVEYYFTCTPALPLYILNTQPEIDLLTYVDADLYVFHDLNPIYNEIGTHSIAIIEHRFPEYLRGLEIHGKYNVGWLSFRRDRQGFACLHWWRQQCIEWCYDRVEDGKFADQKYLEGWPTRFNNIIVLQHKGANVAPWNLMNYTFRFSQDKVMVDEQPLVFFHFHGLRQVTKWLYNPGFAMYQANPSRVLLKHIYQPYIQKLAYEQQQIDNLLPKQVKKGNVRYQRGGLRLVKSLIKQRHLVMVGGYVF